MTFAGNILEFFNSTNITSSFPPSSSDSINKKSLSKVTSPKLAVQFGAYATFQSFFGLAGLSDAVPDVFQNTIPDYASSMAFELYTNTTPASSVSSVNDLYVRFLYANATTGTDTAHDLSSYALFNSASGSSAQGMRYADFVSNMQKFAVNGQEQWCSMCGNSTGSCAAYSKSSGASESGSQGLNEGQGSGGMSNAVAGVIGAMVTLGVILAIEGAILLLGGFRLARKSRASESGAVDGTSTSKA